MIKSKLNSLVVATLRRLLCVGVAALSMGMAAANEPVLSEYDEIMVGFHAGLSPQSRDALLRRHGATLIESSDKGQITRVRVRTSQAAKAARELAADPHVKFVARNEVFGPALQPSDPQFAEQWHLVRIQAPQAWDITQGEPSVVIAIVDSGVDPHHPDLAGKLLPGFNTHDNTTNTADQYGHGTKMAGVAAARSNNNEGIAGVAGQASIMPMRVTDRAGRATSASISTGIIWAVDHGAKVINLSLDGVLRNAAILAAAEYAFSHGALVVAPSGNCGCAESTPETPYILSVSATDENDRIDVSSTRGSFVDLSAPGTNILTTTMFGLYLGDSGTSLASAVVAGVAALMYSVNPALTPAEVTALLETTAFDGGVTGHDPRFGYGRVNAFAAVKAAAAYKAQPKSESAAGTDN